MECKSCGGSNGHLADICSYCGCSFPRINEPNPTRTNVAVPVANDISARDTNESLSAQNKISAGICGILFGSLGVHKFILGYKNEALTMLLFTVLTGGFGWFVMGPIGFIEGIIYLTKSDREFVEIYIKYKRGWF